MLRIFYGTAGTGKSSAAMEEIKNGAGTGERYIMLVPEQYSHEAERELSEKCGDGLSLYAEVLSFTGLARAVSNELGGGAVNYLSKSGRLLCMALAADGLYSRLKVYGAARHRAQVQSMLLSAVSELKTSCISSRQLAEAAESCEGALGDKLHDLSLVLEAYDAVIANGSADPNDRLGALAQRIAASSFCEKTHIYADGFTDFTAQERSVLEALLLKGVQLTVCLGCDELGGGSEVFELGRITARRLTAFAREHGILCETKKFESDSGKAEPLRFFAENMFGYGKLTYPEKTDCIKILRASDRSAECELAAAETARLVRETGCRRRDVAIAAGGFDDYRLSLEAAFARYGLPLYTARKADMRSKPIPALISAAYEVVLGGWETDDIMDYLRTGLAGLNTDECDELENYVFLWQLHGGAWLRSEPWHMHPEGYGAEYTDKTEETLSRINALRERAAEPLRRFARGCADAATARGQAEALALLFSDLKLAERLGEKAQELTDSGRGAAAQEYAQLWDLTVDTLEQCAAILGDAQADAEYFGRLFTLMLSRADIGTIPASLDCVTAGEPDRMRKRHIKHLIVLGATDERLPAAAQDTGVFSSDERSRLFEMDIDLGGSGDGELWRAFANAYNCLTLPSDTLTLIYPARDTNGAEQRPSFIVNRAKALFSLETQEPGLDRARLNSPGAALELAANSLGGGGVYASSAAEFFRRHEPERLSALERSARLSRGSLSRASVKALYGDKLYLSASRIDRFASCRFSYFMQYALRAKPRTPAQFTAPEIGSFVHKMLEQVCAEVHALGGFGSVDDKQILSLADKFTQEFIRTHLNDFREKSERFKHLFKRLRSDLHDILLDLAAEMRSSDFEPLSFELDFSKTPELPPLRLGDGEDSLSLTGVADRVDGWLHEGKLYLRVIDYKTGDKTFDISDVLYGRNLQMLLYLFSLAENGDKLYEHEIVPAGVMYVPARSPEVKADAPIGDAEFAKKRSSELRRKGLVLDDPNVLYAMEHSDKPVFLPVSSRSKSALVSAERLGILAKHIDKTLCEMAAELRAGSIAADPYYAKQEDTACKNCEYFDACRFADGENGEAMRPTPHLEATRVWNILEGVEENG